MRTHPILPLVLALALCWTAVAAAQDDIAAEAAEAVAAEAAVADLEQEQLDAQAQQYVQMLQPLMWRELEFIRLTCDLEPDQRPKIKAAGEKSLKQAARDMLRPQGRMPANAATTIRKEIAKALEETLTKEELATYTAEAAKRTASRKKAAIACVVAQLDTALFLTGEQRDKIAQSLETNWQEDWEQWLQLWQYGGQYFPVIPDQHLTPHLNKQQTKVWQGFQKVGFGWWGGHMQRQPDDDEWWNGDAAKATGQADAAPEKE